MLQGDDGVADSFGALVRGGGERGAGRAEGARPAGRRYAVRAAGISDSMNFVVRRAWRFIA